MFWLICKNFSKSLSSLPTTHPNLAFGEGSDKFPKYFISFSIFHGGKRKFANRTEGKLWADKEWTGFSACP